MCSSEEKKKAGLQAWGDSQACWELRKEGQEDWPQLIALIPKQEEKGGHHGSDAFVPWK